MGESLGQATGVMTMLQPLTDGDLSSAAPSISSAKSCVTSSATFCAKSFTCVLHVSPKGRRRGTRVLPRLSLRCSKAQHVLRTILRGAWVPPLEDDARHDKHLQQYLEEKVVMVVVAAAAAAAAVVVVVVRGGKLAFGCLGAHTSST